jgi:hypothetical protein
VRCENISVHRGNIPALTRIASGRGEPVRRVGDSSTRRRLFTSAENYFKIIFAPDTRPDPLRPETSNHRKRRMRPAAARVYGFDYEN